MKAMNYEAEGCSQDSEAVIKIWALNTVLNQNLDGIWGGEVGQGELIKV